MAKAKDKKFTLEEHLENANDLAIAMHHLGKVFQRCQSKYYKTNKLYKTLFKVAPSNINGVFPKVQSELDEEFHKIIDEKLFKEHGNIYYGYEKRYQKIKIKDTYQ